MKGIRFSEFFLYLSISFFLFLFAIFPLYHKSMLTPANHIYTMAQVRIADFYIYQAVMGQGARGHWLAEHPFVNEPHERTLVYFYFILLGKIARIIGISNPLMYFIAVYVNLIGLVASIIWLLKTIFLDKRFLRLAAFFLIFFAATWPRLKIGEIREIWGMGEVDWFSDWPWNLQWSSVYHRLTHVPHHTVAEIFLIISVILLVRFWQEKRKIWALLAGLLQALSAIIFPAPTLVLVFATVLAVYLMLVSQGLKKIGGLKMIWGMLFFALLSGSPLLILQRQLGSGYPWNLEKAIVEENHLRLALGLDIDYLLMFGVLALFIPFAVKKSLFDDFSKVLVWALFLSPLLLIPIVPFFGLPSWRVVTAAPFVWAGILASWGIEKFLNLARHYCKRNPRGWFWPVVVGILLVCAPQAFFYWWREAQPLYPSQIYISKAGMKALEVLDQLANEGDVVLSLQHLGIFIPAVTKAKGFMAVPPWTYKLNEKFTATRAFYNGEMSRNEALEFLQKNNIKFVFIGWDEKVYWQKVSYDFLKPVYQKEGIILYQLIR